MSVSSPSGERHAPARYGPGEMSRLSSRRWVATASLAALVAVAGCGQGTDISGGPVIGKKGKDEEAAVALGFPGFATKNTTRVGGADPIADAAGVALAVFSSPAPTQRARAVTLVDVEDWRAGIAASVFMSTPIRAPVLLTDGGDMPDATSRAMEALNPQGARAADRSQVIRVGNAAKTGGRKTLEIKGANPYALAQQIDRVQSSALGKTSDRVVIASGDNAAYAVPAAGWAAKSGDSVLFVKRDTVPKETVSALRAHQQPKIYVLGPPHVISEKAVMQLRRLGTVRRIAGPNPIANSIAFARFVDGVFGWGVVDPGHGLVFVNASRPMDAAAAAPLSASGTYGPLLLVDASGLSNTLIQYLLDIQPGYRGNPVRGVYNHGWVIGDSKAISVADQTRIDALLEISPEYAAPTQRPSS
jgi:hypothetical protein